MSLGIQAHLKFNMFLRTHPFELRCCHPIVGEWFHVPSRPWGCGHVLQVTWPEFVWEWLELAGEKALTKHRWVGGMSRGKAERVKLQGTRGPWVEAFLTPKLRNTAPTPYQLPIRALLCVLGAVI